MNILTVSKPQSTLAWLASSLLLFFAFGGTDA